MSEASRQLALDIDQRATQRGKVLQFMSDGKQHSADEAISRCGFGTTASMTARIRDLRKPAYGGHKVECSRVGSSGLYLYRLIKKEEA